jgi:hypothetical protein
MRLLLLTAVTGLLGCSRTVTGGFQDSPDKKFRLYGRVYGALGRAFVENTKKTVRISIVANDATETLLLRKEYRVRGADIGWSSIWDSQDNLTVAIFESGPGVGGLRGAEVPTASNHIETASFLLDKQTGKFHEKK